MVPGNKPAARRGRSGLARHAGFTMVELLVVLLLIAMASGLAGLALRDGGEARLEREAARLAALLEAARAESRASGVAVRFELAAADSGEAFHFVGLPPSALGNGRWLEPEVRAHIIGARALVLGPEPLIGAQRIVLQLGERQRTLATDGLSPFSPLDLAADVATSPSGVAGTAAPTRP